MGKLSELKPGKCLEKRMYARRFAVVNDSGQLYGIESDCKHMHASLATGKVAAGVITCNWHGWKYDLATGKCLTKAEFAIKKYTVEIEGDDVYIII